MERPPPSLRKVLPYLNLGKQYSQKDPIVSYYLYFQAVNECMPVTKTDKAAKTFTITLMDQLEKMKSSLKDREEITNNVVGQVYVENTAMKLFTFADNEDRNARFHVNMKKSFYASAFIFETLKVFGEVSDEVEEKRKYAKWKAVDIDKCLKNGITPTPGPPGGDPELGGLGMGPPDGFGTSSEMGPPGGMGTGSGMGPPGGMGTGSGMVPPGGMGTGMGPPGAMGYPDLNPSTSDYNPSTGGYNQQPVPKPRSVPSNEPSTRSSDLSPQQLERVTKLCKFAISSLDYEDKNGAIDNLTRALNLLKTGNET